MCIFLMYFIHTDDIFLSIYLSVCLSIYLFKLIEGILKIIKRSGMAEVP